MSHNIRVGVRTKTLSDTRLRYLSQLGVEDVFIDLKTPENNESLTSAESQESENVEGLTIKKGDVPTTDEFIELKCKLDEFDLNLAGIQTLRPAMYKDIAFGNDHAEVQLRDIKQLIRSMGNAEVRILGYQWMPDSVQRTTPEYATRGGAKATAFNLTEYEENIEISYSEDEFWENYECFLDEVLPVAEESKVELALHPADPPIAPKLNGIPRLFRDVSAFDRALDYHPSTSNKLKLCLGCFSEMGEDVPEIIRHFGDSISFLHFRDVVGTMPEFSEAFIDDPNTNFCEMEAIDALRQSGFNGVILPDHVPRMEGDTEWGHRGRGFTVGYLKGLLKGSSQDT